MGERMAGQYGGSFERKVLCVRMDATARHEVHGTPMRAGCLSGILCRPLSLHELPMATKKSATKKTNPKKSPAKKPVRATSARKKQPRSQRADSVAATVAADSTTDNDSLRLFRVALECNNLGLAQEFYGALLGVRGVRQPGSRIHYLCGAVTLEVVDVATARDPHVVARSVAFAVNDLGEMLLRARELGALSTDDLHGVPAGDIVVRPSGERSFYVEDPWRNSLCFVEAGTEQGE
ncbi:MAG: hypothetical protein ABL997_03870 [Planctomycetota bacterium]